MNRTTTTCLAQCQAHKCTGCDHQAALAAKVQASRNAGCCPHLHDETETLTPIERIAYWGAVGFAVGGTVFVLFGFAGYLAAQLSF